MSKQQYRRYGDVGLGFMTVLDKKKQTKHNRPGDHPMGGVGRSAAALTGGVRGEPDTPPPPGATRGPKQSESRVGVDADATPPPPKIPRLAHLTPHERRVETEFADEFEKNPDKMAGQFREMVVATTKPGDSPTFGTDDAKMLHKAWRGDGISNEERSSNRATLNTVMHQTANAVAKRAFVQHLDTMKPGEEVLVTVGGCGAGKGYALGNVPVALTMKKKAGAVWDSAGDQNSTENRWIQKELEKRGLKGNYVHVEAEPYKQWANPERGVVKRAGNPKDGRMVDAHVFADSYASGAKNHQAFYEKNKNNPNAKFVFLKNGDAGPTQVKGISSKALNINRKDLYNHAVRTVMLNPDVPVHVKRGATVGARIWGVPGD